MARRAVSARRRAAAQAPDSTPPGDGQVAVFGEGQVAGFAAGGDGQVAGFATGGDGQVAGFAAGGEGHVADFAAGGEGLVAGLAAGGEGLVAGFAAGGEGLVAGFATGGDGQVAGFTAGGEGLVAGFAAGGEGKVAGFATGGDGQVAGFAAGGDGQVAGFAAGGEGQVAGFAAGGEGQVAGFAAGGEGQVAARSWPAGVAKVSGLGSQDGPEVARRGPLARGRVSKSALPGEARVGERAERLLASISDLCRAEQEAGSIGEFRKAVTACLVSVLATNCAVVFPPRQGPLGQAWPAAEKGWPWPDPTEAMWLADLVRTHGSPLLFADGGVPLPGFLRARGLRSGLLLATGPAGGECGLLGVFSRDSRAFGATETSFVTAVAGVLAAAERRAGGHLGRSGNALFEAFRANPLPTWLWDEITGELAAANHAFCDLLGVPHDFAPGRLPAERSLWADQAQRSRIHESIARGETVDRVVAGVACRGGVVRDCLVSATKVAVSGQEYTLFIACDETERLTGERALQQRLADAENRERMLIALNDRVATEARLLRQQRVQLLAVDELNRAIAAQESLAGVFDLLGELLSAIVPHDSLYALEWTGPASASLIWSAASRMHEPPLPVRLGGRRGDWVLRSLVILFGADCMRYPGAVEAGGAGPPLSCLMSLPLLLDDSPHGALVVGTCDSGGFDDEQRSLLMMVAANLSVALEHARAVESLRDLAAREADFVAVAAHELRTPLAVLRGYVGIMASDAFDLSDQERHDFLDRISQSCDHLADLLDKLLDAARAQRRGAALEMAAVDIAALASAVWTDLIRRHPGRHCQISRHQAWALAERETLRQILAILLENALAYSSSESEPTVGWSRRGRSKLRVEIENASAPFSASDMRKLFTRFGRLPRHRDTPGAGLGLITARALVEQLGGRVGCENRKGTVCFWVELPVPGGGRTRKTT